MSKITPQQAFEAAKTLWPKAESIRNDVSRISVHNGKAWHQCGDAEVDWPEGVDRWPPQPEPKWRDARMPEDFGKEAVFQDERKADLWYGQGRTLCGMWRDIDREVWIDNSGTEWRYCQVRDTEPAPTFGGKAIEIKADPTLKPGEMAIKPAATKPTITIGGEIVEVDTIEITTRSAMKEAILKGSPVQCGIDWAKPGTEKTVTEPKTVPFIGGPNDGRFAFCDRKRRCVSVPVADNQEGYYADEDSPRPRLKQFVYDLRTIADVSMYAPSGMTDQDILIRLFENYHPPKAAT